MNVVLYYGRFNPPHVGHLGLCRRLAEFAKSNNAKVRMALSGSQDSEKNPLDFNTKKVYVDEMVEPFGFEVVNKPVNSIYELVRDTAFDIQEGDVTLVCGADRVKSYSGMVASAMKKYQSRGELTHVNATVTSLMERDDAEAFSATQMRKMASEGNLEGFLSKVPFANKELGKDMYDDVRAGMGIDESVKEFMDNERLLEAQMSGSLNSTMDIVKKMEAKASEHKNQMTGESDHIYLIGGAVRDILLGKTPNDLDLITTMYYKDYASMFDTKDIRFRGKQIIVVPVVEGEEFETACLQKGQSMEDNLQYRDLTINSMAMNPLTKEVIDPCGGQADLSARVLKLTDFMHDAIAAGGQPVAVLRCIRFFGTYGWKLDEESKNALKEFAKKNNGQLKVTERQFEKDWHKLERGSNKEAALKLIDELGFTDYLMKTQPLFKPLDSTEGE